LSTRILNVFVLAGEMTQTFQIERSDAIYRRMRDPAFLKHFYKIKTISSLEGNEISGSSPTDIFVGRFGYPKVNIGPLIPPEFGNTSNLASPESWRNINIEKLVEMRMKLVRGMHVLNIHDVEKGRVAEQMRDLALAERPTTADMSFNNRPLSRFSASSDSEPFGPSVVMKALDISNLRYESKLESRYSDRDATATTSMVELYGRGVPVSRIQRALSAGTLGIGKKRKFVPTRWSITAVDDTLSKSNLEKVKSFTPIDSIQAYYNVALDNRWLIFLLPRNWEYESIEAFYPNTTWNEGGNKISIFGSYEPYQGRTTYAEMGGCYYSGRLAVTERLLKMQKQAAALILREVHDGYIMPVGVWNVREHVRQTLETTPVTLSGFQEMLSYAKSKFTLNINEWIRTSKILTDTIRQRRIGDYMK
jgi:DNA repair protein NreA